MKTLQPPKANTPKILNEKKQRCRRIRIITVPLCLALFGLFFISIHMDPRAPFLISISLLALPVPILFAATLLYYHIKLFPEYDYGGRSAKEIRALPFSERYLKERKRLRIRKAAKFALIVLCVLIGTVPFVFNRQTEDAFIRTLQRILTVLDLLPGACIVLLTRSLTADVFQRRQLEVFKYER